MADKSKGKAFEVETQAAMTKPPKAPGEPPALKAASKPVEVEIVADPQPPRSDVRIVDPEALGFEPDDLVISVTPPQPSSVASAMLPAPFPPEGPPPGFIETAEGLPNSCTVCGERITTPTWYAPNVDRALAGGGFCYPDAWLMRDPTYFDKPGYARGR